MSALGGFGHRLERGSAAPYPVSFDNCSAGVQGAGFQEQSDRCVLKSLGFARGDFAEQKKGRKANTKWIKTIVLVGTWLTALALTRTAPNVLLILTDDQSYGTTGAF
jgi:hypothetical protein